MYYQIHEILGTDKPIFRDKSNDYLTLDEILHVEGNPNDFEHVGYVRVQKFGKALLSPIYSKTE